ncbi:MULTISPECIES: DEAD/DEAH box helicase [unclassified Brevundimonas]|uniref:DEAD/DEAH box helicase n=1 Tax=unclassified Brevundimonas TaxID=2622653 RepID=UPI0025B8B6E3|nr:MULTISPECIES: DEAD/DEAH box helicase [unclassified Brevundimonas]
MQALADKVWNNPAFHSAAARLQQGWIAKELGVDPPNPPTLEEAGRVIRASAILACSDDPTHRQQAFRSATSAFELFGADELPLDQAIRVVLARLGNFPAMGTRSAIEKARAHLPAPLFGEELVVSDARTIRLGERSVVLTDYQWNLWKRLQRKERVAVAAPTSAGKSFILQNFIGGLFDDARPRTVVYLVPTRALISQVSADLRRIVAGQPPASIVEIATVPLERTTPLPVRAVFVMTQERLQMTVSAHTEFAANVVIVDEAHSVGEGARGILLQWVIEDLLRRNPDTQLLFASPQIRNLDVFGDMFGLSDVEQLPSREPTVAQNFLIVRPEGTRFDEVSVHYVENDRTTTEITKVKLERRSPSRRRRLIEISARLGMGSTNLVYANGAGDAEHIAIELAKLFKERVPTKRQSALAQLAAETVHESYALVECVQRGVAFHYSNMPALVRQAVEQAVVAGDIDYLVCTSTLLQGVNLPAKNIFMCRPEKGDDKPLESVDFWNLAGRAGRLLKEFQGNIFLIDYDSWRRKPLSQPRDALIVPALQTALTTSADELTSIFRNGMGPARNNELLEAAFVRLLDDHAHDRMPQVIGRLSSPAGGDGFALVSSLVADAALDVALPTSVLRRSPNISPHKQQALYRFLHEWASTSEVAARSLVPLHPRDTHAYGCYAAILQICHQLIMGMRHESRVHRFLAIIVLRWMKGHPLPRIIQNQLNRNPEKNRREVVRETLELVEKRVRYDCWRLFSCYGSVLSAVLIDLGRTDLVEAMPPIPLFLEVGASDRTTISLMSAGIPRAIAMRLADFPKQPLVDVEAARRWLRTAPLADYGLSPLLMKEVRDVIDTIR